MAIETGTFLVMSRHGVRLDTAQTLPDALRAAATPGFGDRGAYVWQRNAAPGYPHVWRPDGLVRCWNDRHCQGHAHLAKPVHV